MTTSVVIVSYRPDEWLAKAIASVVEQADEVVVVDNASSDGIASQIARTHGARPVPSAKNLGFAGGVNVGVRVAGGDVVAVLNDDAVAGDGWLRGASDLLAREPDVAAVAPKILLHQRFAAISFDDRTWFSPGDPRPLGRQLTSVDVDGRDVLHELVGGVHRVEREPGGRVWRWTSGPDEVYVPIGEADRLPTITVDGEAVQPRRVVDLVNSAGAYLSGEGHGGDHGSDTPDDGQFDVRRTCFGVCGAAFVTTRDVIDRVGFMESRFFAYYEDLDWSWRVRLAGFDIVYDPTARVRHRSGATSGGERSPSTRRMASLNRIETLARNAPPQVVVAQLKRLGEPGQPERLRRPASLRAARGFAARPMLRRRWVRRPREVWDRWAGVDESWPHRGRVGDAPAIPPALRFGE